MAKKDKKVDPAERMWEGVESVTEEFWHSVRVVAWLAFIAFVLWLAS